MSSLLWTPELKIACVMGRWHQVWTMSVIDRILVWLLLKLWLMNANTTRSTLLWEPREASCPPVKQIDMLARKHVFLISSVVWSAFEQIWTIKTRLLLFSMLSLGCTLFLKMSCSFENTKVKTFCSQKTRQIRFNLHRFFPFFFNLPVSVFGSNCPSFSHSD